MTPASARIGALFVALAVLSAALSGCGSSSSGEDDTRPPLDAAGVPARRVAVVVEGCALDTWQRGTLESAAARKVVREVVLVCPVLRTTGDVDPADPDARARIEGLVASLHAGGYRVSLAATIGDDLDVAYSAQRTIDALASPDFRSRAVAGLRAIAASADGVELALFSLPDAVRDDLTRLVDALHAELGPSKPIGVLVPPALGAVSDLPGAGAFDLAALAPSVARIRVMTLDFSCCGAGPGPTVDTGWAVDAVRFARSRAAAVPLDVAFPLYGTDFSELGERAVSYLEAQATAASARVVPSRGPSGALQFDYVDGSSRGHSIWFDDAASTLRALRAWDEATLPSDVGVVFYGLGAEDPSLWPTLARGLP